MGREITSKRFISHRPRVFASRAMSMSIDSASYEANAASLSSACVREIWTTLPATGETNVQSSPAVEALTRSRSEYE